MDPNASKHGKVIFIENDFRIAATGQWALIDMGRQHCVQIGDQINVFRRARPDLPREAIASAIIIDVRGATSTIKILGVRDTVDIGSEVQLNTTR
jgi:cytochrome c oxidase assembly protein Cox11